MKWQLNIDMGVDYQKIMKKKHQEKWKNAFDSLKYKSFQSRPWTTADIYHTQEEGKGTVFTGVCLSTPGGTLVSGPRSLPSLWSHALSGGGTPVLGSFWRPPGPRPFLWGRVPQSQLGVPQSQLGYPSLRQGVPQFQVGVLQS